MYYSKKKAKKAAFVLAVVVAFATSLGGCSQGGTAQSLPSKEEKSRNAASGAVNFAHELDSYQPKKDSYNFYFTYKIVHPWWDAVALGMEEEGDNRYL